MTTKDFRFDIKTVADDGTFEGWLSVYDVVDLGNDVVKPGAFTKTIQENSGKVPMLWQHDTKQPIGTLELSDRSEGLWVKGTLLLEIQRAKEAYALIKANVIRGLSIGYKAIADKTKVVAGVRQLSELKLFEGSVVTFPMLPAAQIQTVKSDSKDFLAELDMAETWSRRYMMMDALCGTMDTIVWSDDTAAEKITQTAESIDQFREAYLAFLPKLLTLRGDKTQATEVPNKAGRRLSSASQTMVMEAIAKLQALLGEEPGGTPKGAAPASQVAAPPSIEPEELHSLLSGFRNAVSATSISKP
jgi:uncharacterized protein